MHKCMHVYIMVHTIFVWWIRVNEEKIEQDMQHNRYAYWAAHAITSMGRRCCYCCLHTQLLQGSPYSTTILQPRKRATVYSYWRDDQRWEGGPTVRNVVHAPFPIDNCASEGVIKQWAASVHCCPPIMNKLIVPWSAVGWWNNGGPPTTTYILWV